MSAKNYEPLITDQVKFLEITELLVAAGYFRARIKGLAPFDKVICDKIYLIANLYNS